MLGQIVQKDRLKKMNNKVQYEDISIAFALKILAENE